MKFPKSLILSSGLFFALPCSADVFILKDGTRFEGRILEEKDDSYLLEVNVTKSIKDERLVAKADIEKIERNQTDLLAFEGIKDLAPTPDLLTSDQYDVRILAVEAFLKEFPNSAKAKEARKISETLKAEAIPVSAGGIKLNGNIISAEDYKANAYDLDASVSAAKIRTQIEERNFLGALRLFSEFDRDFAGTEAHTALLPLIRSTIITHRDQATTTLASYDARLKNQQTGLDRMTPEERANSQRALEEQAASLEARFQSEKTERQLWPSTHPLHKASLEETVRTADNELRRLESVSAQTRPDGGKLFREAWSAIQKGEQQAITEALNAARSARLPERYMQALNQASKSSQP